MLLLPSLIEQWGLVANEAMAAGLPVVASDSAGCVPDLVEDDVTGFVRSPYDCNAWSEIMYYLHNNSETVLPRLRKEVENRISLFRLMDHVMSLRHLCAVVQFNEGLGKRLLCSFVCGCIVLARVVSRVFKFTGLAGQKCE